ncbi:MAG TPA: RHS repeat-associated core domain-containing protein, partial [Mucilaginibacter sp.]|nr:RHS repeat-associated core domain-containing protein [Mucilaginibacter sp.]
SINGKKVARYNVTINSDQTRTLTPNSFYDPNTLSITITKDENWTSGRAGTTEEYKNLQGQVILKRVYNYKNSALEVLSTYYVYDDLGNLAFVLPPMANGDAGTTISSPTLNNLCYQYRYDQRNRLTQKKIPGKGWEFVIYNTLDQVVMTQDANQRNQAPQTWAVTKYDALGRVIITALYKSPGSVADTSKNSPDVTLLNSLQNYYNATTNPKWENRNNSDPSGYDNLSDPNYQSPLTYLTINYFDDYLAPNEPTNYTAPAGATIQRRGLLTATKTAVLNTINNATPDMLWSVHYYDDFGRSTESYTQHYLGGTLSQYNYDDVVTGYNFTNADTLIRRKHYIKNSGNTAAVLSVTIANSYRYDHVGRKIKTWEQITNGTSSPTTRTLISQIDYNEIGQLLTKHLHSIDSVNFLQNIAYIYNERGWLMTSSAPLFAMRLYYNTATGNKAYNGNIMYQYWGTPGNLNKYFVYTYDKINRLLSGISLAGNNESVAYDQMGNIVNLNRYTTSTATDQLTYSYVNGGNPTNQVQSITDATSSANGLVPGITKYTYDGNGNTLTQTNTVNTVQNKTFTYNLLNLPQTVTVSTGTLTYTYDAAGNKLRKVSVINSITHTTDYISGIQYDGSTTDTLNFIQTEEGKAAKAGSIYDYTYYLGDNLSNTRVTFGTKTGSVVSYQTDDYYPFGMEISNTVLSPKNEYLYNKKELQEELGQYDYGARYYDPVIGKWTSVDPSAENDASLSPYIYGFDNSVKFTDPDGRWPDGDCCGVVGAFAGGLYNDLKGAVTGTIDALSHPIQTVTAIAKLGVDPVTQMQAVSALHDAATSGYQKFKSGDANVKAAMIGGLVGEVGQLFGGEIAEVGKLGKVGKLAEVTKLAEGANDVSKANDVFVVTRDGVAIPKGDKYKIPDNLVENPNRSGSYGTMEKGKFKEEKLRIDPATPPGKKGPNTSHYHKNNKSTHYVPDGKDPGFK